MSFFSGITDSIKRKMAEAKERREFLDYTAEQTRGIRRKAYLNQAIKNAKVEGAEMAKKASANNLPKERKTAEDFGFSKGISDPMKYINPQKEKVEPIVKTKKNKKRRKKK